MTIYLFFNLLALKRTGALSIELNMNNNNNNNRTKTD